MKKYLFGIVLVLSLVIAPLTTSAVTIAELQNQIAALMAQLAALQNNRSVCQFTHDLSLGDGDNDGLSGEVTALQRILISGGYLRVAKPTGWFGKMTMNAVKQWQNANAKVGRAVSGNGSINASDRGILCGNIPDSSSSISISNVSGPTSLNVNQTGTWSVSVKGPSGTNLNYRVAWGEYDGYAGVSAKPVSVNLVNQTGTFTHAYSNPGTYTIRFNVYDYDKCDPTGNSSCVAQASLTVVVGSSNSVQPIVIQDVKYSPASPKVNELITTTVTITNSSLNHYNLPFKVNVQGTTVTVPSLLAREWKTVTVPNAFSFSEPGTKTLNTSIIYPLSYDPAQGNVGDTFTNTLTFTADSTSNPYISSVSYEKASHKVTVWGSNLNGVNAVYIDNTLTIVNDRIADSDGKKFTFILPADIAAIAGNHSLILMNVAGLGSNMVTLSVNQAPYIRSVNYSFGTASNRDIVIVGERLDKVNAIYVDGGQISAGYSIGDNGNMQFLLPTSIARGSHTMQLGSVYGRSNSAPFLVSN
ncbi:MAG: peptidoglycan-binding domain-containing protein [Candidatus Paceibacterota bacterium]|jgi:hypothetical protein